MASAGAWPALLSWLAGWSRRRYRDEIGADTAAAATTPALALKEVVERKRRNETVRQREFDHLRQLRRRGLGGDVPPGGSSRSLFDTTQAAPPHERAQTLRKIDRVEAQMARQGWPGAGEPAVPAQGALSDATLAPTAEDDAARPSGFAPTVPPLEVAHSVDDAAASFGYRPRKPTVPVMPPVSESDAALEEAALRWALGDGADARAALLLGRAPAVIEALTGDASPAGPALAGQLCGDIDAVLAALSRPQQAPAACLTVACARLTRVDFAAAGCLLNWAQAHQARGCQVQFRDVSPLVAAFLRVVGLTEHAQVVHAPSKPA